MRTDPDFERLRKALYCGRPDRVPLAEITIDEEAKEKFLGRSVNDLSADIEFYVRAGYDYMTLGRRIAGFPPVWDAARLNNYYEVQRQTAQGTSKGTISNWDDFNSYPWPKPEDLDFRILDKAREMLPEKMKVVRYLGPVFQMAWMLMGFEAFSFQLTDNPDLVEAMMERIFEIVCHELEDALQRDIVGAVWYGDDIVLKDRLLVSPAFLRRNFFPRLKSIVDACRKKDIPLIYHTDGDISEVLEDIINSRVNALHPVDPTAMDIYLVKKKVNGRLCVIGNIDVELLTVGTPEQVAEDARKHIVLLAPDGGYAMGSGNSIPRTVKIENYRAMLETTLAYGKYPIAPAGSFTK